MDDGDARVLRDISGFPLELQSSQFSGRPGDDLTSSITLKVFRAFVRTSFDCEANGSYNKSRNSGYLRARKNGQIRTLGVVLGPRRRIDALLAIDGSGLDGAEFTAIATVARAVLSHGAVSRAIQEQLALSDVLRERSRALNFRASFLEADELSKKFAAHAWQKMVVPERSLTVQLIYKRKPRRRIERHGHRHRTI